MASIRKLGERYEIRECLRTERGPRQHTLASFRGVLSPEVLDRAEAKARKPFDREALLLRASRLGVAISHRRRFPEARALLAWLQGGGQLDPTLVGLLRAALDRMPSEPTPEHLAEAADWIGQSEGERGRALRGLVRAADRIARARGPIRERERDVFPRFRSEPETAS